MKKILLLIILIVSPLFAQKKTCDSPKGSPSEELNIITKCLVNSKKKKTRQLYVSISANKRRFLKKRRNLKKEVAGIDNNIGTSDIYRSSDLSSESLDLKNNAAVASDLSAEEVRNAEKFSTVDQIPTFKKCKATNDKLDCFYDEMIDHIGKHFNYPTDAVIKKIEGEVWVRFVIDSDGNVKNIKTLGPENGELLNEEAKRIVSKLPAFIPGTKNGKNTTVKYGFPINFSLQE